MSQSWTLAMQYRSRRSAFFASTVQAVLDMIYVFFLLPMARGFGQINYLLNITSYKNQTHPSIISKYGIVVNVSPGRLDMLMIQPLKIFFGNAFVNLG